MVECYGESFSIDHTHIDSFHFLNEKYGKTFGNHVLKEIF